MRYILYAVTALYAILTFIAAFSQLKKTEQKTSYAVISVGALLLITAIGLHIINMPYNWIAAVIGGIFICISAVYNGKKSGGFHIMHHIIRLAVTLLLIAGFVFV